MADGGEEKTFLRAPAREIGSSRADYITFYYNFPVASPIRDDINGKRVLVRSRTNDDDDDDDVSNGIASRIN